MSLDLQAQAYLERLAAFKMPLIHTLVPEQLRQGMRMQLAQLGAPEPIAHVADRMIPGPTGALPIRIYTPEGSGPFPILVFFHGGGFVLGDLDTHDGICRRLANGASCLVVSVAYPLAPEHKFPAAPKACYAPLLSGLPGTQLSSMVMPPGLPWAAIVQVAISLRSLRRWPEIKEALH